MIKPKPVLAVDIDEVLIPFRPNFLRFHNQTYGTNFDLNQFHGYLDELDEAVYLQKISSFVSQVNQGWGKPIVGAAESLKRLKRQYEIYVVTARHHIAKPHTQEWLDAHFPGLFNGLHFVRDPSDDSLRPKSKTCLELGAKILIDDELRHAVDCASEGVRVLLFGSYPWNDAADLPANVKRVMDWQQVEEELSRGS